MMRVTREISQQGDCYWKGGTIRWGVGGEVEMCSVCVGGGGYLVK